MKVNLKFQVNLKLQVNFQLNLFLDIKVQVKVRGGYFSSWPICFCSTVAI